MIEEIKSILYESYYHDVGISKEDIKKIMNFIDKQQKEIELLKYYDRSSNYFELKYK